MSLGDWEVVIGIETHAQLMTQSKIFSGASIAFGAEPNTQACAVDLALPGTLPVMNREAVAGEAWHASMAPPTVASRLDLEYHSRPGTRVPG